MQVQVITNNIREIKGTKVNLKLKTCIEGSMKSIGTYKHAVNKLNMINISMDKTSCTSSDYGFSG